MFCGDKQLVRNDCSILWDILRDHSDQKALVTKRGRLFVMSDHQFLPAPPFNRSKKTALCTMVYKGNPVCEKEGSPGHFCGYGQRRYVLIRCCTRWFCMFANDQSRDGAQYYVFSLAGSVGILDTRPNVGYFSHFSTSDIARIMCRISRWQILAWLKSYFGLLRHVNFNRKLMFCIKHYL